MNTPNALPFSPAAYAYTPTLAVPADLDEQAQLFIKRTEERLEQLLEQRRHTLLGDAARHLCLAPGAKRARPLLTFLFGAAAIDAAGEEMDDDKLEFLINASVCIELMHSASLMHDDVVDNGSLRRGRPTVNAQFGNTAAVLSGDLALSIALRAAARLPVVFLEQCFAVIEEMSQAAIDEIRARGDALMPLDAWRQMAMGKTGALFGLCGFAGGLVASYRPKRAVQNIDVQTRSVAERFDMVGRLLGIAFQLADDVDDISGDDKQDHLGDVVEQNPSYPVLWAAQHDASLLARLEQLWHGGSPSAPTASTTTTTTTSNATMPALLLEIEQQLHQSGALDESRRIITQEVRTACTLLGDNAAHPALRAIAAWACSLGVRP